VETVHLKTLYILFFIELGTRRVWLGGVTDHPSGPWVVQRARELSMERETGRPGNSVPQFLVHDRDTKFTRAVDDVFVAGGTQIIKTPIQAPNANAYAERWVRTVRQECLDWLLIWGRRHLEAVLDEYVRHDNDERPHRSLDLRPPTVTSAESAPHVVAVATAVRRRDRLGGLVHEYYEAAA
jgi:transposase InsO family protein